MAVCVGIGGGSGAGKSTLAQGLAARLPGLVTILELDWYYRDQRHRSMAEREALNFDDPDAIEADILEVQLRELLARRAVDVPVYNYAEHVREPATRRMNASAVIVVEGLHALGYPALRALMDIKVYMELAADLRLARRLQRDVVERGRTAEEVLRRYLADVRPMHEAHVAPTRHYADFIFQGDAGEEGVETLAEAVRKRLAEQDHAN